MIKLDPIIAVKNLKTSANWYEQVFGFKTSGLHIVNVKDENGEIILCLHPWEKDKHPTMMNPEIAPGNGFMFYFRTDNIETIYKKIKAIGLTLEEDLHENPRPQKKEFSLRDPDGYFITVSEYHEYGN